LTNGKRFWNYKSEMYYLNKYECLNKLGQNIDKYIHFYNTGRLTLKIRLANTA